MHKNFTWKELIQWWENSVKTISRIANFSAHSTLLMTASSHVCSNTLWHQKIARKRCGNFILCFPLKALKFPLFRIKKKYLELKTNTMLLIRQLATRVVYDRVRKRKNYFEIPTFLQIERGKFKTSKSKQKRLCFCFHLILNFPLLKFLVHNLKRR